MNTTCFMNKLHHECSVNSLVSKITMLDGGKPNFVFNNNDIISELKIVIINIFCKPCRC